MRIISGKFRGQNLVPFNADHIRPTTDRVKESLFNRLQFDIEGSRVLDLFSGTGNLSFESISRGAKEVQAVELNKKSVEIFEKNRQKLKVGREELKLHKIDVFKFVQNYSGPAFDIVFIDPPFTEKWGDKVMHVVAESLVYGPSTRIAIETAKKEPFADSYGPLVLEHQKDYGDKKLSFFCKETSEE